ncbi:hypothetical protein PG993_012446 [Apiospora rasikravindrae]|uniref:Uncharacterized protein n=1 Tax=Apiospora rasikravindrae TaxID=990691 RepID=A0ABR1S3W8_9PEZI
MSDDSPNASDNSPNASDDSPEFDDSINLSDDCTTEFDNSNITHNDSLVTAEESMMTADESIMTTDDAVTKPDNSDIYFGVEIEAVFKMHKDLVAKLHKGLDYFERFCDGQSRIFVDQLSPKLRSQLFLHTDDYSQWQFSRDPSIENMGEIKPSDLAHSELQEIWSVVESKVMTSHPKFFRGCSTHIHFSFSEQQDAPGKVLDFPVHKARKIFMAAQVLEKAIDDLMPDGWTDREFARSLQTESEEEANKPKTVDNLCEWWASMNSCETMAQLSGKVNFVKNHVEDPEFKSPDCRYFKWNCFSYRPQIQYRTIEFRQPPFALSPRDVELWVTFVVGFVKAAVLVDEKQIDAAAETGDDDSIRRLFYVADEHFMVSPDYRRQALKIFILEGMNVRKHFWDELGSIKKKVDLFFYA